MATMIGVDLGAQSGRVAVGRFDGQRLSISHVHRFANVPVRTRGTLYWDILSLYEGVLDGVRGATRENVQIDSIAVDSWAVDFGLLDRRGRLLQNPVHYRDARRASSVDGVLAVVSARELYQRTGIQLLPINTIFELAAMAAEADPALEIAQDLLLIPDLLHYWLAGVRVAESTNATTTQCLDSHDRVWAVDLLERLDIPTGPLPEVMPAGSVIGPVSADVAEETGLQGTQVVATATHDTAAAVAAIPFREAGAVYISAGTWSLVGIEVHAPLIDDRTFAANLTNEGGVEGTVRLLRNVTGLWLLHECQRIWGTSFDELVELARAATPLRSVIDVDDPLFAVPGDMPRRVREFCASTGQPIPEEQGAVVRCILESLALKHLEALELLRRAAGASPRTVHMVGGGSRNELLCQMTADATGLLVIAGPAEATEIGNLLVQAMALGELRSLEQAREVVRESFQTRSYDPRDSHVWHEARQRFEQVAAGSQPAKAEVRR
jgi:sugar (pentulose or hexulose) kinase